MSEARRDLLDAMKVASDDLATLHNQLLNASIPSGFKHSMMDRIVFIRNKMEAAIAAELKAPPAVTEKPGFDGRATDYPDFVENYR